MQQKAGSEVSGNAFFDLDQYWAILQTSKTQRRTCLDPSENEVLADIISGQLNLENHNATRSSLPVQKCGIYNIFALALKLQQPPEASRCASQASKTSQA